MRTRSYTSLGKMLLFPYSRAHPFLQCVIWVPLGPTCTWKRLKGVSLSLSFSLCLSLRNAKRGENYTRQSSVNIEIVWWFCGDALWAFHRDVLSWRGDHTNVGNSSKSQVRGWWNSWLLWGTGQREYRGLCVCLVDRGCLQREFLCLRDATVWYRGEEIPDSFNGVHYCSILIVRMMINGTTGYWNFDRSIKE